jgi:hypothetical protein
MPHKRADSKARQNALDEMFQALTELDGAVTEAEFRDQRIAASEGEKIKANRERFPALGNPGAGLTGVQA